MRSQGICEISPRARPTPRIAGARAGKSKITLGYLSADYRQHAVAYLIAELFELHDRSCFEVFGYSYGPDDGSPLRRRLVGSFDKFVDMRNVSYQESAQRIAADEVDILVDLTGYTTHHRMPILALCPAPIQVNYLGYPGTMGADVIDYIIVDDFIVPLEQQPFYTERLVHLPCYEINDSRRKYRRILPHARNAVYRPRALSFAISTTPSRSIPECSTYGWTCSRKCQAACFGSLKAIASSPPIYATRRRSAASLPNDWCLPRNARCRSIWRDIV